MDLPAERMMQVSAGQRLPEWRIESVSAEKMKLLAAILRDPNPIHWDPDEVAKRGLGHRVINQGPTNLGYVTNMLMDWAGPACLRHLEVRFSSNVFDGDDVVAGGVVVGVREENGERLADCDVWLDRGDGGRAVEGRATVAIEVEP
jgi:acyl dehydratase